MKKYYRVMLGRRSVHAQACFTGNFIGADFDITQDLTGKLPNEWRGFNKAFIPVYLKLHPEKSRIAAGLSCGFLWTVAKGIMTGDIVLSPDGNKRYQVGEVTGDYHYVAGDILPHRRAVKWLNQSIDPSEMSDALRHSARAIGTVSNITAYKDEIEKLIGIGPVIVTTDPEIEDPAEFALEKHLEDFLVKNWGKTDFGKEYDIFKDAGEKVGQQYLTDTGPIDILAIRKDKKELLVLELKKGRASDVVIGQILRYMGYVLQELAEKGQTVKGVIIALEDDQKIRRALAATSNIEFYRYQVNFKLLKV